MRNLRPSPLLVRTICLIAVAVSFQYLVWRALHTLNPEAPLLSLVLYVAECFGLVLFLMHVFLTWDTRSLERRLGLASGQSLAEAVLPAPGTHTVDVFIPTYNESVALLRKTVLAAREIRLPHETWLLDDGRRDAVRELCDELGVRYLTRDSNAHAKAGNINAALAQTGGEFIVVLDADFIARPGLLERTLPHFEADGRLAFVQLPQAFYNVDSVQHVDGDLGSGWHEQTLFYDIIQPGKNRWNAAFWCGSPAILRREALESVGGAATTTITEDILTSMRMHAAGWRSLYHNEILAVGVAPGDLDGYRTQRLRWAQGSMQILRSRENPLWKRGLSVPQRISYFASMATYFQAVQLAVFVAMPALILASGESPMTSVGIAFFAQFIPYMVVTTLANKVVGGASQRILWDQYFAFLRMFTFLRAMGTLVTGGRKLRFRVTSKAPSGSAQRRGLYPHIVAMALNVFAVVALLVSPLRQDFDNGTSYIVAFCAACVAGVYAIALTRLWRRVYRRHDYRVRTGLSASVAIDGDAEFLADTEDVSFGGASILLPRAVEPGSRVVVRLLGTDRISIRSTVMTATRTSEGKHRIGVRFEPLAAEAEHRLLLLLLGAALDTHPAARDEVAAGADQRPALTRAA